MFFYSFYLALNSFKTNKNNPLSFVYCPNSKSSKALHFNNNKQKQPLIKATFNTADKRHSAIPRVPFPCMS